MLFGSDRLFRHVVPPSLVKKTKRSVPDTVRDGTTPDGHFDPVIQVIVCEPPFVNSNVNDDTVPLVAILLTVNVVAPVIVP
jgi:hypothetical protein